MLKLTKFSTNDVLYVKAENISWFTDEFVYDSITKKFHDVTTIRVGEERFQVNEKSDEIHRMIVDEEAKRSVTPCAALAIALNRPEDIA